MKCTSAIRQMTYDSIPDALDEYMLMGVTTVRKSLVALCVAVLKLYGNEFLRKLTYNDIEKLYARHDEKHEFPRMIGRIDCTGWSWETCPIALKAQFCRVDHKLDSFILLEAISSQDLWIWHAFFGVSGMNNDVTAIPYF
ncbi:ALP1-like protein [Tanacetum coccineum]|uniref:ALP1-like protein n=1 Tax=Tanacetum coccineum TaxID=301880 RepID=A0ABQ4WYC4_9ASTR